MTDELYELCKQNSCDPKKVQDRMLRIERRIADLRQEPYTAYQLAIAAIGQLVNQRDRMKKENKP